MDRATWSERAGAAGPPLTQSELDDLRGLGDPISLDEVRDIYVPLSGLLHPLATQVERPPFLVGIAGSVAVGKSTIARLLRLLLSRWPKRPRVELVTTDGFLHPNAILQERGIMNRKGFPESYDRRALLRFVTDLKAGASDVSAPVYSHLAYDIVTGQRQSLRHPDIVILEGLNVLQPAPSGRQAVGDFFDFSIYIDADTDDIRHWYIERFLALRRTAFADPSSYFHRYATLPDDAAVRQASRIWRDINEVNLIFNILPTRSRAQLILRKGPNHAVEKVLLRRG
jgi:type I pantothenate kinase